VLTNSRIWKNTSEFKNAFFFFSDSTKREKKGRKRKPAPR